MILLTFYSPDGLRLGIKTPAGVLDVKAALEALRYPPEEAPPVTVQAALEEESGLSRLARFTGRALVRASEASDAFLAEESLRFAPPVPSPGKILCIGLNYMDHIRESKMAVPKKPVMFAKFSNALCGNGDTVILPRESAQVDYEAELAVVIGRRASNVSEAEALGYVAGYTCLNDVGWAFAAWSTGRRSRTPTQPRWSSR
jgi:2-keto-4-pentenoate hydratase/2-oxohepta-3-ene-1,7-dioic acid hydratase in catechol pathway